MEERASHAALEQEIIDLTKAVEGINSPEIGKEILREALKERIYSSSLPPVPNLSSPKASQGDTASVGRGTLPKYVDELPPTARLKVDKLIDLAWHKGLMAAIREVRLSDPLLWICFTTRLPKSFLVSSKNAAY